MPGPTALRPGAYYHIFNRGNNRENLFREERNYPYFLQLYAHHVEPVAETYVYCLLKNHFHVLVRIKEAARNPAPSQALSNLFNAYTKAINKAHGRTGSLFEHPFGRIEVTDNKYLWHLVTYIHRNPQRHQLVSDFRDWKYSSYHALLAKGETKLQRQTVIGWFDTANRFVEAHSQENLEPALDKLAPDDFD
jgi:REP element-mobilizing transposase RayT